MRSKDEARNDSLNSFEQRGASNRVLCTNSNLKVSSFLFILNFRKLEMRSEYQENVFEWTKSGSNDVLVVT